MRYRPVHEIRVVHTAIDMYGRIRSPQTHFHVRLFRQWLHAVYTQRRVIRLFSNNGIIRRRNYAKLLQIHKQMRPPEPSASFARADLSNIFLLNFSRCENSRFLVDDKS